MNDYDPANHSSDEAAPATTAVQERRPGGRRLLSKKTCGLILAAGLTCAAAGLAGAGTSSAADLSTTAAAPTDTITPTPPDDGGAVTGPEPGGSTGIIDSVSTSSFTFTTAMGVEVTVEETSTTKYKRGNAHATVSAVKTGASVLVLGTVDSADITATQVTIQPGGDGGAAAAAAAGVIPFEQGVPSPDQSVGKIPEYTEGEGTIVTGNIADKATTAALAVVPGGIADRVVQLDNGEYEVHNISTNWPHHVFLSKSFKVVGWE